MAVSDEKSYEEMIEALHKYLGALEESCETISAAATDCVDNMEGDESALNAAEKVQKCVGDIQLNFEEIQAIIDGLRDELEELQEIRARTTQE